MHVFARTTYNQIYSAKKKKRPPPEGQVSGWTCRTCVQNLRVLSLKNGVDILTFVRKPFEIYVVARNYLVLMLDLSFCVMFHLIFSIGRSDLRMLRETFYRQACVGVDAVASFTKKNGGKKFLLRKHLTIFGICDGLCGRWGYIFAAGANPSSCYRKVAMSHSFTCSRGII